MKTLLSLLGALASLTAAAQTVNIPVQVSVGANGTTVTVPAQTITLPMGTPQCGTVPATTSSSISCPAGTNGSWMQTKTYAAIPAPNCWNPILTPTTAPAGTCTSPVIPPTSNCGMVLGSKVSFCETFDKPAGNGNRAGDLDGNVWGASRAMGSGVNFGQHNYNLWNPTQIVNCDGSTSKVIAPHDIIICNGQLREATNDNNSGANEAGDVTIFALYPKQPFDFAGRTGTVSFDVSNDTAGSHAAWPEFWVSDLPVPTPFNHFDSWQALPANGFGIRLAAQAPIGMVGTCPNGNNIDKYRWTVGSVAVVRNYVLDDTDGYGPGIVKVKYLDCVTVASGPGQMNHVELRIAQNQIDVYATDAGVAATAATLRHIAVITNANLTLTRGLVWLEDSHYNADKGEAARPSQKQHTFAWDNLAFDGPFTYRDFAFDALDNTVPGSNGGVNLGKYSDAGQTSSWSIAGLPANPKAAAARVLFNFSGENGAAASALSVTVNGHQHSVPWPYPDKIPGWRTFAVTVPLTDLIAGTNTVLLGSDKAEVFSNVDIVLVNVTGGVPVLPGSNNKYPGT